MRDLIGISGKPRAGKDSIADVLVKHFGYTKLSFADPLKTITSNVFKIPLDEFYGDNKDEPYDKPVIVTKTHLCLLIDELGVDPNREQEFFDLFEGTELGSHRRMLQFVGTDVVRKHVDEEYWLKEFHKRTDEIGAVVCADARMPNERELIKDMGGEIILVTRPDFIIEDSHESENSLGTPEEYDVLVSNDSTLLALQVDIKFWYRTLREKRVRTYLSEKHLDRKTNY